MADVNRVNKLLDQYEAECQRVQDVIKPEIWLKDNAPILPIEEMRMFMECIEGTDEDW